MCLICEDLDKKALTFEEAWNNLREVKPTITEEHLNEVRDRIFKGFDEEQYCLFCILSNGVLRCLDFSDEKYYIHII